MMNRTRDYESSGRSSSARSKHSISASVRLDGLVVINDPTMDNEDDILGMKEMSDNMNATIKGDGYHQLYRVNGEHQNDDHDVDEENHRDLSNQRNITSEWNTNRSGRSTRTDSIDKSGRSTSISSTESPTRNPPIMDRSSRKPSGFDTKESLSSASRPAHPSGRIIPSDEDEEEDAPPSWNHPLAKSPPDELSNPTTANPVKNEKSTPPTRTPSTDSTSTITLGDSSSSADLKPSFKSLDASNRTSSSQKSGHTTTSSSSILKSEHTRRTGNHRGKKSTKRKTTKSPTRVVGFSPKVELNGLVVLHRMHPSSSDDTNSEKEEVEASLSTDDIFNIVPATNTSSDDDSFIGSPRPPGGGGSNPSLPSIQELKEFDNSKALHGSKVSIFSDSSRKSKRKKMQRKNSMGSIDARLTANSMRPLLQHTREVQSFYEPTTCLSERQPQILEVLQKQAARQKEIVGGRKLPAPWKHKSKKQRAREKRQQERKEAKRRAIRLQQLASREAYQPLSHSFPVLKQPEEVFISCRGLAGAQRTEVLVTTEDLEPVATLSYTQLKPNDRLRNLVSGRRVLRDADGNQCALILHTRNLQGRSTFKICGPVPMSRNHKSVDGYFVWAEVRNIGEVNPQFRMTIKKDADLEGQSVRFKTRRTGSRWLPCMDSEASGFSIDRKKEDGSKLGGCASISNYKDCRGLRVNANIDFGLMLCFALVVDEMVANRIL